MGVISSLSLTSVGPRRASDHDRSAVCLIYFLSYNDLSFRDALLLEQSLSRRRFRPCQTNIHYSCYADWRGNKCELRRRGRDAHIYLYSFLLFSIPAIPPSLASLVRARFVCARALGERRAVSSILLLKLGHLVAVLPSRRRIVCLEEFCYATVLSSLSLAVLSPPLGSVVTSLRKAGFHVHARAWDFRPYLGSSPFLVCQIVP